MSSRAQIIATLGPASSSQEVIRAMITGGMDVARINYSHGSHEGNAKLIETVRLEARNAGRSVPVIQDLSGPRVQTGTVHAFDPEMSVITDKDIADLDSGIALGVEYIAQSFVGGPNDIAALRSLISERGGAARIIAKIERKEAVDAFDAILAIADAIMIARGDLGEAVPREDVPFIEKMIIEKAREAKKPVITATQLLYTMTENPTPTRAEVTDIAYAIILGSDAVMLSEETARGKHPREAVAEMERVIQRTERERSLDIHPL